VVSGFSSPGSPNYPYSPTTFHFAAARYTCACGNGAIDPGERCDDPSLGCCVGCVLQPVGAPCSDGELCTSGEACDAGGHCVGGAATVCPPCETCNPSVGCIAAPRPTCKRPTLPLRASLKLRDATPDTGDQIVWKWKKGAATSAADLADPLGTSDYALCLFDESAATPARLLGALAPAGGQCGSRPCWSTSSTGARYADPAQTPDGLDRIKLHIGTEGRASATVRGRGADLDFPSLPLPTPLRVQLQAEGGACWEATFAAAGASRNDTSGFAGRGD